MLDSKYKEIRIDAGGVVKNKKGQIALIRMSGSYWGFPKGKIEDGEEKLIAATREVGEETGIKDLVLIKDLGVYERPRADKPEVLLILNMFLFETAEENLSVNCDDVDSAKWVEADKVVEVLTQLEDREFFARIKDKITN